MIELLKKKTIETRERETQLAKVQATREAEREQYIQKAVDAEVEVTPDVLKKVYHYFEEKSNPSVIYIVEALVGLMRGTKQADNKSVELYLKKHESLKIALYRLHVRSDKMNMQHCIEHLEKLEELDKVIQTKEFTIFKPFRNLLEMFCRIGLIDHEISKASKEI